jgi:hypothetical protein
MKQEFNNDNKEKSQLHQELPKIEIPKFSFTDNGEETTKPLPSQSSTNLQPPENKGKELQKPVDNTVINAETDYFGIDEINKYADGKVNKRFNWLQKNFTEKSLYEAVKTVQNERIIVSHRYQIKMYETGMMYRLTAVTEFLTGKLQTLKVEVRGQVASFASHKLENVTRDISAGLRQYLQQHKNDYDYCESLQGYPTYENYRTYLMAQELKLFKYFDAVLENFVGSIIEKIKRFDQ